MSRHRPLALVFFSAVVACTPFGPEAQDGGSAYNPRLSVTEIYPAGARRPFEVTVTGSPQPITFQLDGVDVPATFKGNDAGRVLFAVELPAGVEEGRHQLEGVAASGRTNKLTLALRDQGFYSWSNTWPSHVVHDQCEGPWEEDGGARVVCGVAVEAAIFTDVFHFVKGREPTFYLWRTTIDLPGEGYHAFSYLVRDGEALVVGANRSMQTVLLAARPLDWEPGTADATTLATLDGDACGLTVWHGRGGPLLVVTTSEAMFLVEWLPDSLAVGRTMELVGLPDGFAPCAAGADDLDGDGDDELALIARDFPGFAVLRGNVDVGFAIVDHTFNDVVPFDINSSFLVFQQRRASFFDLDGDGLKDIIATREGGGVDVLFTNGDGTFEHAQDLVGHADAPGAAAAVRFHPDGATYVLLDDAVSTTPFAYRFLERHRSIEESWRVQFGGGGSPEWPRLVFDIDGDGYMDTMVASQLTVIALWRRPGFEQQDGVFGPRPLVERPLDEWK